MSLFRGLALGVGVLVLLVSMAAWGQGPTGHLRVTVKDPSGAGVAATGRLKNLSSGRVLRFQADTGGVQRFDDVPAGRYRLEVTAAGFATTAMLLDVEPGAEVSRTVELRLMARLDRMNVVETTPLGGSSLSALETPLPVQAGDGRDVTHSGAVDMADYLTRRMSGVYVNEMQGNPYQADVNYRGYTASPLLGTPQGMSIYMDGVRLNQPFGDVVSWDLVPRFAITEVRLIPGSNPMFGLNTLGGALSLETKDGREGNHTELSLRGGSFGRKMAELEHGGADSRGLSWYGGTSLFFEDGWREHSPSDVRQFFGRVGWQDSKTSVGLTAFYANNGLVGNGLQEQRLLGRDYRSVYTVPDKTANLAPAFNLMARRRVGRVELSGNVYQRYIRTITLNGDINDDSLDQAVYQPNGAERAALSWAGYSGFPTAGESAANTPFPKWRCIAQALLRDEPGEKCNGLLNRSRAGQHSVGGAMQGMWFATAGAWRNQLTAGGTFDHSAVGFQQMTELGYLNADRSVTGVGAFGDGVTGGDVDGAPFDTQVSLDGRINTGSLYVTDTVSGRRWNFTFAGRYNRTTVENRDRVRPAGEASLTASHAFERFNPAAGVTYSPISAVNTYFSYSEGSRAPTSVELGCANPELPCKLPNAMAGDPPLKLVVARTLEAGVRSGAESRVNWSVGWFRGVNSNDILFVASTATGFGYFKNFGRTRRQGMEAAASGEVGRISVGGGYTLLDATYESREMLNGAGNSTNSGGIQVGPGDRIPLTPRHMLKGRAEARVTKRLTVDVNVIGMSSSLARGNENNLHRPDGVYYLGPGQSGGYSVMNVGARFQVHGRVELFGQVNNVLNHRYYTAAQLGATGITADGAFVARPFPGAGGEYPLIHSTFLAPGAPIGAWVGMRWGF